MAVDIKESGRYSPVTGVNDLGVLTVDMGAIAWMRSPLMSRSPVKGAVSRVPS